jgi:hypothetical protein
MDKWVEERNSFMGWNGDTRCVMSNKDVFMYTWNRYVGVVLKDIRVTFALNKDTDYIYYRKMFGKVGHGWYRLTKEDRKKFRKKDLKRLDDVLFLYRI